MALISTISTMASRSANQPQPSIPANAANTTLAALQPASFLSQIAALLPPAQVGMTSQLSPQSTAYVAPRVDVAQAKQ